MKSGIMELRSKFMLQFEVQQPRFSLKYNEREKRQSAYVLAVYNSRDTFQPLYGRWKSLEVHCNNDEQRIHRPSFAKIECSKLPDLSFSRLQVTGQDNHNNMQRRDFGRLVAREALTDEEYWAAAWLRAEAHWESVSYMRHVDSYKRKFAEQEFYALKRRCCGQDGNSLKCYCFVAVKKDQKSFLRTVLNSVMGTMDLSIHQFLNGETYPGEVKRVNSVLASQEPLNGHKYAYIANVCVMKLARHWSIATNMLYLAIDVATSAGMKQVYVHVNTDNIPAQKLYQKVGFKNVEAASAPLAKEQMILMSMDLRQGCKFCSKN